MKRTYFLLILFLTVFTSGCSPLKPVSSTKNDSINKFKYFYVTPTGSLTSNSGATISGQFYSSSKNINPGEVITGVLSKKGFIKLPDLKSEFSEETLIVNYGESGRRKTGLGGYTIEVTIQFISSKSKNLVCACTAEGQGETEVDDIREAINRCLNELLGK